MSILFLDALFSFKLYTSGEGGRLSPVFGKWYSCPLLLDENDHLYDCRIILDGKVLALGVEYELPIKFLDFDSARKKITIGKPILIWEGKYIGVGKIIKLYK